MIRQHLDSCKYHPRQC